MVAKLELSTTPHPQPYSLRRCHDKLDITHQTVVQFSIGKFSCEILCDVIPVPMVSCYLLLGEPWYKENKVVYNFLANTYTVTRDKIYVLKVMEKKPFTAWRKDRLQKTREQKEAKKKEDAAAAIFVASVKLRDDVFPLETELKPRTVSLEEGEDDTRPTQLLKVQVEWKRRLCMRFGPWQQQGTCIQGKSSIRMPMIHVRLHAIWIPWIESESGLKGKRFGLSGTK
jgi:hypothetical protein